MDLYEVVSWLNEYLKLGDFPDDQSVNGLQVEGRKEVSKIAAATDACLEVFEKAKEEGADLILVHHGLYWRNVSPLITSYMVSRVRVLLNNRISLYAAHLPLDAHPEVGNNVQILRTLGFKPEKWPHDKTSYFSTVNISFDDLVHGIGEKIAEPNLVLQFGTEEVKRLIVGSGGSTHLVYSAEPGDTVLVGEFSHYGYHYVKEKEISVIAAGHYATETFGVKALAKKLEEKFGIPWVFIDSPTGL